MMTQRKRSIALFRRRESGGVSAMNLMLMFVMIGLGGYAVDVGNAITDRTQLQVAADAAAHAALLTRELNSAEEAAAKAVAVAEEVMPVEQFGTVLRQQDITFGKYDPDTNVFTPVVGSRDAVRVTARQTAANANPLQTYLLRIVGFDDWDIVATSVFMTYRPTCLREGFVAEGVVDLQSNNSYTNGFCIHSNTYVSLNSNNYFEPGTVVSMTDLDLIDLPNSGYKTNIGLQDALREGSWNIRIIQRIDDLIAGLRTYDSRYKPDYITSTTTVTLPRRTVEQTDLIPGRVHVFNCSGGSALTIKQNVVMSNVVLISSCRLKFETGVRLEDAIVAVTDTSDQAITSASGVQVGRNDNCAAGGGAQILTMGSMNFPADLKLYGGQLLAVRNIEFSANATGIQGAAMVAGGEISGTSNMSMGHCATGMEDNFHAEYFRMVQ
jgi:Flp pilus assembly protein TadG